MKTEAASAHTRTAEAAERPPLSFFRRKTAPGPRAHGILAYIHSLRPAIVHRDVNPKNLIQREDGEIFLVDFGGVQEAICLEAAGSGTVIGTPGYVPMEQYMGRATPRGLPPGGHEDPPGGRGGLPGTDVRPEELARAGRG